MGCISSKHEGTSNDFSKGTKSSTKHEVPLSRMTSHEVESVTASSEQATDKNLLQKDFKEFLYDVSISCHENQLDWVETHLLPLLENKLKLHCYLPERDRPAGVSRTEMIKTFTLATTRVSRRAIQMAYSNKTQISYGIKPPDDRSLGGYGVSLSVVNSRKTIICFSPDYIESSWKQYEALMAHYMDPMGHNGIFIPIVLEDCDLPLQYQGLSMIRWPQSSYPQYKQSLQLKFFWTNLVKAVGVQSDSQRNTRDSIKLS